jgi:hypothetical protein
MGSAGMGYLIRLNPQSPQQPMAANWLERALMTDERRRLSALRIAWLLSAA